MKRKKKNKQPNIDCIYELDCVGVDPLTEKGKITIQQKVEPIPNWGWID